MPIKRDLRAFLNKIPLYISDVLKLDKSLGKPMLRGIEPTNACFMDCIMCPHRIMKRKIDFMDMNLFKKIINQAKWNNTLWMNNLGESLMHPKIAEMVRYVANKGIKAKIAVNPNLLTEKMCNDLIDAGIHTLLITIDGVDDKTYKYYRGKNADFKDAVKKVDGLLRIKKQRKSDLKIIICMIKMKKNKHQAEQFKKIWNKPGVNSVNIGEFTTWSGCDKDIIELGDEDTLSKRFIKKKKHCSEPWLGIIATAAGNAIPCCYDYDEQYIIGDLKKDSLKKIFNNKRMITLRRQIRTGRKENDLCKTCRDRKGTVLFRILKNLRINN